jgi:PAS domain S-box-containing protein
LTPAQFLDLARVLPEPTLFITGDGCILATNPAALKFLGRRRDELQGRMISELVLDPPEKVRDYLLACSRSGAMVIGALTLQTPEGAPFLCRCEGAVIQPWSAGVPAQILIRLAPKDLASSRFLLLNRQIEQLTREIHERRRAEEQAHQERERLQVTLTSIGDAVIATDEKGRVTFMNQVAETLTGWGQAEAIGEPLNVVFNIINEYSREPVENPVNKVLREGTVVGLANHTILITKDGNERPIDDSGAPLRGREKGIFGVVLVFRDVTERKRAEEERERLLEGERGARIEAQTAQLLSAELLKREAAARQAAEQASRAKDEFLATVSHELRTPLNAILGWLELLRRGSISEEFVGRALETIERNARSQAQLIEDLLDVSRIITGKLRLNVQQVELALIIKEAVDVVRPAADAKEIDLQVILDTDAGPVSGDPDRLQQVVWNLLANAIKFTKKGGRVQVRLERVNSYAEIVVSDTGQGISAEFLPYIFDRFSQADSSYSRRYGGLGLGLAIVRQLVELHGGTVRALSSGEGHGATFIVRFPFAIVQDIGRLATAVLYKERIASNTHRPSCPPALSGLRMLVVEDEADSREFIKVMLEQCEAEVRAVGSAAEALEMLQQWRPDVLISDIQMPGEDGYHLIKKVRSLSVEQGGGVPAIALTAHTRGEDRLQALSAGYDTHIAKPVEYVELETVIASLVRRSRSA